MAVHAQNCNNLFKSVCDKVLIQNRTALQYISIIFLHRSTFLFSLQLRLNSYVCFVIFYAIGSYKIPLGNIWFKGLHIKIYPHVTAVGMMSGKFAWLEETIESKKQLWTSCPHEQPSKKHSDLWTLDVTGQTENNMNRAAFYSSCPLFQFHFPFSLSVKKLSRRLREAKNNL